MRRCTPDTASGSVQQPPRQLLVCLLGSFKHWVAGLATVTDSISTWRPIPCARLLPNWHLPRLTAFRYGARHPNCVVTLWLAWAELWGECGGTGTSASSAPQFGVWYTYDSLALQAVTVNPALPLWFGYLLVRRSGWCKGFWDGIRRTGSPP